MCDGFGEVFAELFTDVLLVFDELVDGLDAGLFEVLFADALVMADDSAIEVTAFFAVDFLCQYMVCGKNASFTAWLSCTRERLAIFLTSRKMSLGMVGSPQPQPRTHVLQWIKKDINAKIRSNKIIGRLQQSSSETRALASRDRAGTGGMDCAHY